MDSPTKPGRRSPKEEPSLPPPAATVATTSLAGTKRSAPSLLPAFEPLSSSPGLPRPVKRQNTGHAHLKYPTPVPTSSTGILSSSPPRRDGVNHLQLQPQRPRPALARTASGRAPLSAVPCVELSENGETLMMGRSSHSSHFQLSADRLVSRVHVKVRYIPPSSDGLPLEPSSGKIEIICSGWNGLTLHCQGKTWELRKGDSFTSETAGTDIIVDVQDARVILQWPTTKEPLAALSDASWDDSPTRRNSANLFASGGGLLPSSPMRRAPRIESPTSPSPGHHLSSSDKLLAHMPTDRNGEEAIQIYEDEPDPAEPGQHAPDVGVSMRTEATASFHSELSGQDENEHDPDEENDPIIHSFGPFGGNISNRLASILSKSPQSPKIAKPQFRFLAGGSPSAGILRPGPPLATAATAAGPSSPTKREIKSEPSVHKRQTSAESTLSSIPELDSPSSESPVDPVLANHVVNQLAFARSSSTPLSTIMQSLPADAKQGLTVQALRRMMEACPTIGTITRSGKDAAGKPLESEYYYVPEGDQDEHRRGLVVDGLRKPSLRACRKQHKQYYWKRPKTP